MIALLRALVCPFAHLTLVVLDAATRSPGPVAGGEAVAGPGQTPEGEGAPTCVPSPVCAVVSEQVTPHPPVPRPEPEVLIDWHADRATTHLTDAAMWTHIDQWIGDTR